MKYELEWQYSDNPKERSEFEPYTHFVFMLRFPDVPPGDGHVAHFCFNVLQNPDTTNVGISIVRRGFLACIPFEKSDVTKFVEERVTEAFARSSHEEAIADLDLDFVYQDADFSTEFFDDLLEAEELLSQIDKAFDRVKRDGGVSLHQAVVIDDYGTQEEFENAEKLDTETRWQEVPDSDISTNTSIFCFLDPIGFKYYLPAAMTWSIKNYEQDESDCDFFTYLAVLPTVAPREMGRGIGAAWDLDGFIKNHAFSAEQVSSIYRFICFMAIKAGHGMSEDQYEAIKKWRQAAR